MPTETHPIDARPSLSLIAAFMLIVGFGVLALGSHLQPRAGWGQLPASGGATELVEFGD